MNNYFKTTILFAALTSLLFVVGYFIGGSSLGIGFLIFGVILNLVSFFFSDKIALSMVGAKEVSADQLPTIYSDTKYLAQKMNLPMPKLFVSPQMQPNAFATGRGPNSGVVCLTQGIINSLNREELNGVIAHELAHIKNRDILLSTIAAIMASVIGSLVNLAFWSGSSNDEDRNPFVAILLIILAPIAATLIQLAISRSREYLADSTAAKYTGQPQALANALVKISSIAQANPMEDINPALSSLYFANPLGLSSLSELFSTHPPVEKRVQNLLV